MARFTFKLEAVLRHRKNLEEQKHRQIAAEEAAVRAHQDHLASLERSLQEAAEQLRKNELIGPINLANLTAHRRFVANCHRAGMLTVQQIALRSQIIDELRKDLIRLATARKIIEKLRERQLAAWQAARAVKETAENDEIGMNIAVMKSIAESMADSADPMRTNCASVDRY